MADRRPRAFFFLANARTGLCDGYPHLAIVLAEGLMMLGWAISSDVPAWRTGPDDAHLFPGDGLAMQADSDLVVVGEDWAIQGARPLPARMRPDARLVFLERSDLGRHARFLYGDTCRSADLILRCHATRYFRYPDNVRPWAFAISERIQQAIAASPAEADTPRTGAMWNFRMKQHPHTLRLWAEREVRPLLQDRFPMLATIDGEDDPQPNAYDELMRAQSAGRHVRAYYERLGETLVCACFGGWFLLPWPQQEAGLLCRFGRALLRLAQFSTAAVAQWDSWRLWEAFAAGAVVLHVDFERHGFMLPGPLPQKMVHYVPVDVRRPLDALLPILDDVDTLRRIGRAGREWALQHYAPAAMARRLVADLAALSPGG